MEISPQLSIFTAVTLYSYTMAMIMIIWLTKYKEWGSPYSLLVVTIIIWDDTGFKLLAPTVYSSVAPNVHTHSRTGKWVVNSAGATVRILSDLISSAKYPVSFYISTVVALSLLTEVHIRVATLHQGRQSRAFLVTPLRWRSTGWHR